VERSGYFTCEVLGSDGATSATAWLSEDVSDGVLDLKFLGSRDSEDSSSPSVSCSSLFNAHELELDLAFFVDVPTVVRHSSKLVP
jgi:hypothetical protein